MRLSGAIPTEASIRYRARRTDSRAPQNPPHRAGDQPPGPLWRVGSAAPTRGAGRVSECGPDWGGGGATAAVTDGQAAGRQPSPGQRWNIELASSGPRPSHD